MPTVEEAVSAYIKLRDVKKALVAKQKEEIAPLTKKMETIEAWLSKQLLSQGAQNIKTTAGTAFKVTNTTPKVVDEQAFMDFLVENEMLHMLLIKPSAEAVGEYVAAFGHPPPGVTINQETVVRVRK